jgi:hypothetical protein
MLTKALLLFLLGPLALQQYIIPGRPRVDAGCTISDDFNRASLGDDWNNTGGNDATISSNAFRTPGAGGGTSEIYSICQTSTTDQWVTWKYESFSAYDGIKLRSENDGSKGSYAVRLNSRTSLKWRYCTGISCNDIGSGATITQVDNNDYVGVEVEGAGNAVEVRFWDFGSGGPPARGSWGTADVTLTDNCTSNCMDVGKYVGLYDGGNDVGTMDDFNAGDI